MFKVRGKEKNRVSFLAPPERGALAE